MSRSRSTPCRTAGLALSLAAPVWLVCAPSCSRGDRDSETEPTQPSPPRLLELSIDAANQPRDGGPFIAGEEVRIGMRIRGGRPPYRVSVKAVSGKGGSPPIQATAEVGPADDRAIGVEVAARATIARSATSGRYRLEATAVDRTGALSAAAAEELTILGDGAELLPAPAASPFIEITDAGGRRRASFVRGEALTLRARLAAPAPAEVSVRILDPRSDLVGDPLSVPVGADGRLSLDFSVPRLAGAGVHTVEVAAGSTSPARCPLRVDGPAFPAADRLVVDRLRIWGGEDERAPRRGFLQRGEVVVVEARVGGARAAPVAVLRVQGGQEVELARAQVRAPAPDRRIFLRGQWRVPSTMPTGRARLEVEVTDGDDVSTRYREVLIE